MLRFDARTLLDYIREESRIVPPADIEAERLNEINFERYRDIVRAKVMGGVYAVACSGASSVQQWCICCTALTARHLPTVNETTHLDIISFNEEHPASQSAKDAKIHKQEYVGSPSSFASYIRYSTRMLFFHQISSCEKSCTK